LADGWARDAVGRALRRIEGVVPADADALAATFERLLALYRAGRNGIWTFVFRNLARPVWLSRGGAAGGRAGRQPALDSVPPPQPRHEGPAAEALLGYGLWVGGNLATQQDLCALFWARGAERYLAPGGTLAFVLPYAVLNAPVFAGLRAGRMGQVQVRPTGGWALERVWPIFGAQSGSSTTSTCVLFGRREAAAPTRARWTAGRAT
jgi:hypothetical protein